MLKYFKRISEKILTPQITSGEVWKALCADYSTSSLNQHAFYSGSTDYINVASLCCREEKHPVNNPELFVDVLNSQFKTTPLKVNGEFARMLRAFLTCYPAYLPMLSDNIINNLDVQPYRLPFQVSDLDDIVSSLSDDAQFRENIHLAVLLLNHFSDAQSAVFKKFLSAKLSATKSMLRQAACEALIQSHGHIPEIELIVIIDNLLVKLQSDDEVEIREAVLDSLVQLAKELNISRIVSGLIAKLQSNDSKLQHKVFSVLVKIAKRSDADIATIINVLLRCDHIELTRYLTQDLELNEIIARSEMDYSVIVTTLLEKLRHADKNKRKVAARFLGLITGRPGIDSGQVISALTMALNDKSKGVRKDCAYALEAISQRENIDMTSTLNILLASLKYKDYDNYAILLTAILTVGKISRQPHVNYAEQIVALLALLNYADVDVRAAAVNALGTIPGSTELYQNKVLPALLACLEDRSLFLLEMQFDFDEVVLRALWQISNNRALDFTSIIEFFTNNMGQFCWLPRCMIINLLGAFSTRAEFDIALVTPVLLDSLSTVDNDMIDTVTDSLIEIVNQPRGNISSLVPLVIDVLNNTESIARVAAIKVLCEIIKIASIDIKPILSALAIAFLDENPQVRHEIVMALSEAAKRREPHLFMIVPLLLQALQDTQVMVICPAVNALSKIAIRHIDLPEEIIVNEADENSLENNSKKRKWSYENNPYLDLCGRYRYSGKRQKVDEYKNPLKKSLSPRYAMSNTDVGYLVNSLIAMSHNHRKASVRGAAAEALATICERNDANIAAITSAIIETFGMHSCYGIKQAVIRALVKIANSQGGGIKTSIVAFLAAKLAEPKNILVKRSLIEAIVYLTNNKMNQTQMDYCLYGVLAQRYFTSNEKINRLAILETIEKISQQRIIPFHLNTHLKTTELVNVVMSYSEKRVSVTC